jgi:hypothetical protein
VGRSLTPGVRRNRTINLNYDQKKNKTTKKSKTTTQQPEEILQSNKITEKKLLNHTTADKPVPTANHRQRVDAAGA